MSDLYNTISLLCEKHSMTVYKMCKDIGIRGSVLSDLKTGRKKGLSTDTLDKIANYFKVSIDYLLGNETIKLMIQQAVESKNNDCEMQIAGFIQSGRSS